MIRPEDPSVFERLEPRGQGRREMFDRRVDTWITIRPYLFRATFADGLRIEVQVNPEFGSAAEAQAEAMMYMHAVGQLPTVLRKRVKTIWIHRGNYDLGGGNDNILIHTDRAREFIRARNFEEALFHEGTHTSIDPRYKNNRAWRRAQAADPEFISEYGRDHPDREDLAETGLMVYALLHHPERLSARGRSIIETAIPNRIEFFRQFFPEGESIFKRR